MEEFILVVDDNIENLKVVGNILKEENYKVAVTKSGEEALQLLQTMHPVLILLDIMMPKLDGFETCKIIRSKKELRDIPIIFLSAKADISDVITGFSLGAVDYVTKPFQAAELIARVKNHIELRKAKEIIALQAEELKQLNHTKDQIFSVISHDMRTPLASLIMLLNNLTNLNLCEDKGLVEKSLKLMELAANESYQLLDNLLYWSRSQTGNLKCTPVVFNICDQIKRIISLYEFPGIQKKLSFRFLFAEEVLVYADEDMIKTVLRNLISNAIKFAYPGTTVETGVVSQKEEIVISVTNDGPGMSPEVIEKVFSDCEYFTTHGTVGEKGTGLGLKISKTFVGLNSGQIRVTSDAAGKTTFTVTLPYKRTE